MERATVTYYVPTLVTLLVEHGQDLSAEEKINYDTLDRQPMSPLWHTPGCAATAWPSRESRGPTVTVRWRLPIRRIRCDHPACSWLRIPKCLPAFRFCLLVR
jgi:hypothetical protein